jgi:hypothetical protein
MPDYIEENEPMDSTMLNKAWICTGIKIDGTLQSLNQSVNVGNMFRKTTNPTWLEQRHQIAAEKLVLQMENMTFGETKIISQTGPDEDEDTIYTWIRIIGS